MKNVLSLFCVLFFVSEGFSQGKTDGFYRGQGNATAAFGLGFEDTKEYFAGTKKTGLSRSLYYGNLYGAYGVTKDFDVSLSLPYLMSNKNRNFQDIQLFVKYRVLEKEIGKGSFQISLAAGFSTPISNYTIGGLNDIGQQSTVVDGRAIVHYHLKTGWFATLQSGYSFKLEEVPNSIPLTIKLGRTAAKWYYDFYYDYQHSFGGIDYRGTPFPQNFKEFGIHYHKIGGTVYRTFSKRFGVYLSVFYLLGGRNTFQGPSYGAGLVYSFRKN